MKQPPPVNDLTLRLDPTPLPSRADNGLAYIAQERARQVVVKRRLPEDDVSHNARGQLAMAAACYALLAGGQSRHENAPGGTPDVVTMSPLRQWPFCGAAWKPSNNRLKNLVRAGAFIAAEIDRLLAIGERMEAETPTTPEAPAPQTAADE